MPRLPPEGGVVAPCVQAMKCNFFCSSLGDAGFVVVSVVAAGAGAGAFAFAAAAAVALMLQCMPLFRGLRFFGTSPLQGMHSGLVLWLDRRKAS